MLLQYIICISHFFTSLAAISSHLMFSSQFFYHWFELLLNYTGCGTSPKHAYIDFGQLKTVAANQIITSSVYTVCKSPHHLLFCL